MKMKISEKSESDLFKLGIYQAAGGIIGILIIGWAAFHNPFFNSLIALLYLLVVIAFAYSIACGILCLKLHQHALRYSLINQLLQLLSIAIGGFAFEYVAGISLYFGIDFTNTIRLGAEFGISGFSFNFNTDQDQMILYINIVALLLIIWIERIKKRTRQEQTLQGLL